MSYAMNREGKSSGELCGGYVQKEMSGVHTSGPAAAIAKFLSSRSSFNFVLSVLGRALSGFF